MTHAFLLDFFAGAEGSDGLALAFALGLAAAAVGDFFQDTFADLGSSAIWKTNPYEK